MRRLLITGITLLLLSILPSDIRVRCEASAREQVVETTDGVFLFVRVKGDGMPCLYIHGGPGSGSHWAEKLSGDILERHFQMIYLDQRGVARSSSPKDSSYSMERMAKDFEEVRQALGIKRWVTMGHSFGGILQMGYVQRYPDAIAGMIMINCALSLMDGLRSNWIPKACEFLDIRDPSPYANDSLPVQDAMQMLMKQLRAKDLFWKMGYAHEESEHIMNLTFSDIPHWNHDQERAILDRKEYFADFRQLAPEVHVPVLFFYGKTDWMVGPEHYKGVHFPTMLLWGSDVGHVPFIENKADLEKALERYLSMYQKELRRQ